MLKSLLALLFVIASTSSTSAGILPRFSDDEEFEHCAEIMHDWDTCAVDELKRVSHNVKLMYREILAEPQLQNWNGSYNANKKMLEDMFISWNAFKMRICSLSSVASLFLPQMVKEKNACNLYFHHIHTANLNTILYLLNYRNPNNPYPAYLPSADFEYDFLKLFDIDRDEAYLVCKNDKSKSERACTKEELDRETQKIKNMYKTLYSSNNLKKWNNGPDLTQGNYRDMFDSWVTYRNRLCSLAYFAQQNAYGNNIPDNNLCLLSLSKEHNENLESLIKASISFLDADYTPDEPDDGGETEGKKIKPLKRNKQNITNTNKDNSEKNASSVKKDLSKGKTIPSWAKSQK